MSYGFGTTLGWVIKDRIFLFGCTNPLRITKKKKYWFGCIFIYREWLWKREDVQNRCMLLIDRKGWHWQNLYQTAKNPQKLKQADPKMSWRWGGIGSVITSALQGFLAAIMHLVTRYLENLSPQMYSSSLSKQVWQEDLHLLSLTQWRKNGLRSIVCTRVLDLLYVSRVDPLHASNGLSHGGGIRMWHPQCLPISHKSTAPAIWSILPIPPRGMALGEIWLCVSTGGGGLLYCGI